MESPKDLYKNHHWQQYQHQDHCWWYIQPRQGWRHILSVHGMLIWSHCSSSFILQFAEIIFFSHRVEFVGINMSIQGNFLLSPSIFCSRPSPSPCLLMYWASSPLCCSTAIASPTMRNTLLFYPGYAREMMLIPSWPPLYGPLTVDRLGIGSSSPS